MHIKQADYDTLIRHSAMLKNTIAILENLREFGSVAELEAVQSAIRQLNEASTETNDVLAMLDAKRRKVSRVRQRIDRIIRVLPIPTTVLVALFGIYKNGQGVLLVSFFALLLLLMLTLFKHVPVTFIEIIATTAIGVVFIVTMYSSGSIQEFVNRYSAEITAVSLLYALVLPWFTKLANSTK